MKSSSSLSLFKSFRFIAATPGGLGQAWRTGKGREPLRKQVVCSLTAGEIRTGTLRETVRGRPRHMSSFHIPVSVPGGDAGGDGMGRVSISTVARHHAQQLRAWVLKRVLFPWGCRHRTENLGLATGLPSTSLPISPPLASWFHRAEDTEPSMPFTCPFSSYPVLRRTKLPTISAFWAGMLGLGGRGEGVSPQGVARCILEPVHWGNAPPPPQLSFEQMPRACR